MSQTTSTSLISIIELPFAVFTLPARALSKLAQDAAAASADILAALDSHLQCSENCKGVPLSLPPIPLPGGVNQLSVAPLKANQIARIQAPKATIVEMLNALGSHQLIVPRETVPAFRTEILRFAAFPTDNAACTLLRKFSKTHQKTLRDATLDAALQSLIEMKFINATIERTRGRIVARQGNGVGSPSLVVDVFERRNGEIAMAVDADMPLDQCSHALARLKDRLRANGVTVSVERVEKRRIATLRAPAVSHTA